MTIAKTKAPGWGPNEVATSAQLTALDANVTNALDKRAGLSDTLSSIVSMASGGRIIPFLTAGADANVSQNYSVWATNAVYVSALTANRTYQLLNGGGVLTGDSITFFMAATVNSEVAILNAAGSTLYTLGNLRSSDGAWCTIWFNGAAWSLQTNPGSRLWSQTFLASGTTTWTCPPGVLSVFLIGCGQGGGGGGGQNGSGAASTSFTSGSAGAGAHRSVFEAIATTPGAAHSLTIGFSGGGAGSVGSAGGDGADTTFTGASITARFPGGQGGAAGQGSSSANLFMSPSSSTRFTNAGVQTQFQTALSGLPIQTGPGGGGGGSNYYVGASRGLDGGSGYHWGQGGSGGGVGTSAGAGPVYFPGGAGGGGGGGGYGTGGTGGSGGSGNNAGTGFAAGAASAASVNTGGGGGGGGSGGNGSGGGGAGTAGAAGGTGQLTIVWVK